MNNFKFLPIFFLGFINIAHSEYMSNQQLSGILEEVANELKVTSNAAYSGDGYTACNEGKRAIRLFYTINPNKDVPPELLKYYKISQGQILLVVHSMKDVC